MPSTVKVLAGGKGGMWKWAGKRSIEKEGFEGNTMILGVGSKKGWGRSDHERLAPLTEGEKYTGFSILELSVHVRVVHIA